MHRYSTELVGTFLFVFAIALAGVHAGLGGGAAAVIYGLQHPGEQP